MCKENNGEIVVATKWLLEKVIPEASKHLDNNFSMSVEEIVDYLHQEGINLCFMGKVYYAMKNKVSKLKVMTEMLCRVIKSFIMFASRKEKIPQDHSQIIKIFGPTFVKWINSVTEKSYYKSYLIPKLQMSFNMNSLEEFDTDILLKRVSKLTGIELTEEAKLPIKLEDIIKITPLVKRISPSSTRPPEGLRQHLETQLVLLYDKLDASEKWESQVNILSSLVKVCVHQGDNDSAEKFANQALLLCNKYGLEKHINNIKLLLAVVYAATKKTNEFIQIMKSIPDDCREDLFPESSNTWEKWISMEDNTSFMENIVQVYDRNNYDTWKSTHFWITHAVQLASEVINHFFLSLTMLDSIA